MDLIRIQRVVLARVERRFDESGIAHNYGPPVSFRRTQRAADDMHPGSSNCRYNRITNIRNIGAAPLD